MTALLAHVKSVFLGIGFLAAIFAPFLVFGFIGWLIWDEWVVGFAPYFVCMIGFLLWLIGEMVREEWKYKGR